jgi:hypothetical protein
MKRIATALLHAVLATAGATAAAGPALQDFDFWRASAGWWVSDNTYLDRNLDYNIRAYHSVVHVEVIDGLYRETEYKTYPPGPIATWLGQGTTQAEEGVELVSVITGELIDAEGTVRMTAIAPSFGEQPPTEIRLLSPDTALRATGDETTGLDSYRMFITLPTPDRRHILNLGLVSSDSGPGAANAAPDARPGDLRGFSIFRGRRIEAGDADTWRSHFRELHRVGAIVQADKAGAPVVSRPADSPPTR